MSDGIASTSRDLASRRSGTRYLTVFLGEAEFGLPNREVREVVGLTHVTPLARTPSHVRGVINLRGKVVPVIDLRARMGLPRSANTAWTRIVVVHAGDFLVGLIVDRVGVVCHVPPETIEPASAPGGLPAFAVRGVVRTGDGLRILLDVENALGESDTDVGMAGSASA